jgi:predicted ATP-grasp superfamily ATP-dependent carboligase
MATVLVTDAKQRKSVPIIRSLGRRGISVIAGDDARFSMGFFSKYCAESWIYPAPDRQPEQFIDWLLAKARAGTFEVLFAIDERTLDVLTKYHEEISRYVSFPAVNYATYIKARNKWNTITLAQSLGIPCPKTLGLDRLENLSHAVNELTFPVIIKPWLSSGSRGLAYVKTAGELEEACERIHKAYGGLLLQEYIPPGGDTFGVEVLMHWDGNPRATFVHRRLREYPIAGGPSTLRESLAYPELTELGSRLLQAMGWVGVAMVEFKVDPRDGVPKLMEVNPKFWGSIALPIAAGVDFPYLLYQMATKGDVKPVTSYNIGVRCRWLIPGDILHFIHNPDRFRMNPSFFDFSDNNLYYDLLSIDDPGPLWGMFCSGMISTINPDFWRYYLSPRR